jgi:hypothetical protein
MAAADCWGPSCMYTGSGGNSDATKGKCTATAGYIADAGIAEIINDPKRAGSVVKSFFDSTSNSDVLVYDDTQWVSYMSSSTKKTRGALYSAWGFGGTMDWASDLQTFNNAPKPAESWDVFKQLVKAGKVPRGDHTRHGNWTQFYCDDPLVDDLYTFTPTEQWDGLDTDDAWKDVVRVWKDTDSGRHMTFSQSVSQTLNIGNSPACESLLKDNCNAATECGPGLNSDDSGPAAMLIWNSLVLIHQLHSDYHDTQFKAASTIGTMLAKLQDNFAPIPPEVDNTWKLFLIDLLTLGTLSAAGPFFNTLLKNMPYFIGSTLDNAKDTTFTLIGQSTSIAKDQLPLGDEKAKWTPESQDAFSNYLGNVINGWGNVTELALKHLFSGEDDSLEILWKAMSGGKLIVGKRSDTPSDEPGSDTLPDALSEADLRANIGKSIFAFAIPSLWSVSKAYPFIIDTGFGCDAINPIGQYLDDDTMEATGACVENKLYYIASPEGDARICKCEPQEKGPCQTESRVQKFTAPKGLDSLDGTDFGRITKEELITGSVRTYLHNGGKNILIAPNASNQNTMTDLLDVDVTTPGFIHIPVCSPERAFQSWDTADKGSSIAYPCDIPPGRNDCKDSTFEDKTNDASPSVNDCRKIIDNIQGDGSTDWTTAVIGHNQREIAKAGSCSFGVQASKTNGNVNFVFGGQDVIDLINAAIEKFGGSGKVGAEGHTSCNGNVHDQSVTWGIYWCSFRILFELGLCPFHAFFLLY